MKYAVMTYDKTSVYEADFNIIGPFDTRDEAYDALDRACNGNGLEGELHPMTNPDEFDLADELIENGMNDIADTLRMSGAKAALNLVEYELDEARRDPEGFGVGDPHNLEVARDRLTDELQRQSSTS